MDPTNITSPYWYLVHDTFSASEPRISPEPFTLPEVLMIAGLCAVFLFVAGLPGLVKRPEFLAEEPRPAQHGRGKPTSGEIS